MEEKETALGQELKHAINKEKEIYNERIEMLKVKSIRKVKQMAQLGNKLNIGLNNFQKIDLFIAYSF